MFNIFQYFSMMFMDIWWYLMIFGGGTGVVRQQGEHLDEVVVQGLGWRCIPHLTTMCLGKCCFGGFGVHRRKGVMMNYDELCADEPFSNHSSDLKPEQGHMCFQHFALARAAGSKARSLRWVSRIGAPQSCHLCVPMLEMRSSLW